MSSATAEFDRIIFWTLNHQTLAYLCQSPAIKEQRLLSPTISPQRSTGRKPLLKRQGKQCLHRQPAMLREPPEMVWSRPLPRAHQPDDSLAVWWTQSETKKVSNCSRNERRWRKGSIKRVNEKTPFTGLTWTEMITSEVNSILDNGLYVMALQLNCSRCSR